MNWNNTDKSTEENQKKICKQKILKKGITRIKNINVKTKIKEKSQLKRLK